MIEQLAEIGMEKTGVLGQSNNNNKNQSSHEKKKASVRNGKHIWNRRNTESLSEVQKLLKKESNGTKNTIIKLKAQ